MFDRAAGPGRSEALRERLARAEQQQARRARRVMLFLTVVAIVIGLALGGVITALLWAAAVLLPRLTGG